ncbi:23S rRNA pseudouridine(2604) synthase RluF [Colwelliaceae bacterium BS250]
MNTADGKRLNKYISESGFCSRRAADKLIEQGRVTINDKKPELGTKVMPSDIVKVDDNPIGAMPENKSDRVYIAYNKPIGIICTTERDVQGNIIDAIRHKDRIFPIGRLDKPSEGLIFLTSDGDIVNKILRAENSHDKEYIVTVDTPISERFVTRMSKGVPILGTVTKPCKVSMLGKYMFKIVLTQGLNRQIRRMCEYLGYEVTALKRSRIMSVELGQLKPGQWRDLNEQEMQEINLAVADSKKTAPIDQKKIKTYEEKLNPWAKVEAAINAKGPSSYNESDNDSDDNSDDASDSASDSDHKKKGTLSLKPKADPES